MVHAESQEPAPTFSARSNRTCALFARATRAPRRAVVPLRHLRAETACDFSEATVPFRSPHSLRYGVRLATCRRFVETTAAAAPPPSAPAHEPTDDVDLLSRLSEVRAALLRYREETFAARNHLRLRRLRLTQCQALLGEDTRRLNALKGEGQSDRVTIDLLEDAVAGGGSSYETARRESTRAERAIRSLLLRLSRRIESLECDTEAFRSRLSAIGASTYELLTRRHILPLVAYLADGRCSECRWGIPMPLVAELSLRNGLNRCPNCSRVLLRREPGIPSLR